MTTPRTKEAIIQTRKYNQAYKVKIWKAKYYKEKEELEAHLHTMFTGENIEGEIL